MPLLRVFIFSLPNVQGKATLANRRMRGGRLVSLRAVVVEECDKVPEGHSNQVRSRAWSGTGGLAASAPRRRGGRAVPEALPTWEGDLLASMKRRLRRPPGVEAADPVTAGEAASGSVPRSTCPPGPAGSAASGPAPTDFSGRGLRGPAVGRRREPARIDV